MVYLVLDSLRQLIVDSLGHVVIAPVHLNTIQVVTSIKKDLEFLKIIIFEKKIFNF
jgi:hypothetical protein